MPLPRMITISSTLQVIFEVVRGKNFDGSVAIDDLELSGHICPTGNDRCNSWFLRLLPPFGCPCSSPFDLMSR